MRCESGHVCYNNFVSCNTLEVNSLDMLRVHIVIYSWKFFIYFDNLLFLVYSVIV